MRFPLNKRLVDQLEFIKKELHTMKENYEDKSLVLQGKVRQTEKERDTWGSCLEDCSFA